MQISYWPVSSINQIIAKNRHSPLFSKKPKLFNVSPLGYRLNACGWEGTCPLKMNHSLDFPCVVKRIYILAKDRHVYYGMIGNEIISVFRPISQALADASCKFPVSH